MRKEGMAGMLVKPMGKILRDTVRETDMAIGAGRKSKTESVATDTPQQITDWTGSNEKSFSPEEGLSGGQGQEAQGTGNPYDYYNNAEEEPETDNPYDYYLKPEPTQAAGSLGERGKKEEERRNEGSALQGDASASRGRAETSATPEITEDNEGTEGLLQYQEDLINAGLRTPEDYLGTADGTGRTGRTGQTGQTGQTAGEGELPVGNEGTLAVQEEIRDSSQKMEQAVEALDKQIKTLQDFVDTHKKESPEKQRKRAQIERGRKILAAVGDGLQALGNLYFTTQYAPDMFDPNKTGLSKRIVDRLKEERKQMLKDNETLYKYSLKIADLEAKKAGMLMDQAYKKANLAYKQAAEDRAQKKTERDEETYRHKKEELWPNETRAAKAKAEKAEQDAKAAKSNAEIKANDAEHREEQNQAKTQNIQSSTARNNRSNTGKKGGSGSGGKRGRSGGKSTTTTTTTNKYDSKGNLQSTTVTTRKPGASGGGSGKAKKKNPMR